MGNRENIIKGAEKMCLVLSDTTDLTRKLEQKTALREKKAELYRAWISQGAGARSDNFKRREEQLYADYDAVDKEVNALTQKLTDINNRHTPKQIEKYVQQEAALFEAECRQGLVLNGNIKLKDFIENEWLPHKKRELKIRTYKRYTEMLPRIYSALGHLRLDRIRPQHLMSFYEQLSEFVDSVS